MNLIEHISIIVAIIGLYGFSIMDGYNIDLLKKEVKHLKTACNAHQHR